jgi:hypothetical protein
LQDAPRIKAEALPMFELTFVYTTKFHFLPGYILWDETTLIDLFRYNICNDLKDLLLPFNENLTFLTKAISCIVHCGNCFV